MEFKIDLNEIIDCKKCGCIYNYTKGKVNYESNFQRSKIYICKCPCCREERKVFVM